MSFLLHLLWSLLLFLVLQTLKLHQTYLSYVLLLKCSLLHDCHWFYIVMCFSFTDVFFLHFTSTFLALNDLLASNLHLTPISMFKKAKCVFPSNKIHLHSYRCKMVHLLSPMYFISVSNLLFKIPSKCTYCGITPEQYEISHNSLPYSLITALWWWWW